MFSCVTNHKGAANDIIKDATAQAIQLPLATAGIIHTTTKVETEKKRQIKSNHNLRPLDFSFDHTSSGFEKD